MKVFIIAGEASGDQLGAAVIRSLRQKISGLNLRGIGGPAMKEAGLKNSFFPMDELSLMGIVEIVPHVPKLLQRIRQTVDAIKVFNPDIVLTIDAPDFTLRVQKELKKTNCPAKRVHMVAPTVWAWRAGRAKKIARYLDAIFCLYPFEPEYFEREGLKAFFIGHPMMSSGILDGHGSAFRFRNMIAQNQKTVGLFFGSRRREIETLSPIIMQAARALQSGNKDLNFIVPTNPVWHDKIETLLKESGLSAIVTSEPSEKWDAFNACDCAIAVSGTVALEIAVANIPHVILYKMNRLTWEIVDRVIKTPYAHLANILLGREAVPEFIQDEATAEKILPAINQLLKNPQAAELQRQAFHAVREFLQADKQKIPADMAAGILIEMSEN